MILVSPFEDLGSRHQHKEIAGACQSSRWTASLSRRSGSGKVCAVFQIACWLLLLPREAPQSTGHLRVTTWVGQKVAPMHRMEMQLAQNKVSWNAVGLKIGAKTKNFHSKIQLRSFSFGETLLERQVFYTFSRFMLYFLSEHLSKLLYWMDPDTNSKLLSCKV